MEVLVCKKCGAELKAHWIKCPKCKKSVTEELPKCSCGEPLEDDWDECPVCGKAVRTKMGAGLPKYPPEIQAYVDSAIAHHEEGEYYAAIEDFGFAMESFLKLVAAELIDLANFGKMWCGLCRCRAKSYFENEEYGDAVSHFTLAIQREEDDSFDDDEWLAEMYNYRGCAYRNLGNWKDALPDFERAVALDPNNSQYKENLDTARSNCPPKKFGWGWK